MISDNQNLFSQVQRSELKILARLAPFGSCEGEPSPCTPPAFWWLLVILGVTRADRHHFIICLCLHRTLVDDPFVWHRWPLCVAQMALLSLVGTLLLAFRVHLKPKMMSY